MSKMYFDYASTTPADPEVVKAMGPYFFEQFGNASSPHVFGQEAQKALAEARETVARFINAKAEEIVFTSGGSESNNHAILGMARAKKKQGNHLVVSQIEHHSVLRPAEFLEKEGFEVTYLGVDQNGLVDSQEIRKTLTSRTILIAILHASNEIGTIQNIVQVGQIAQENNVLFHVDAVQTVGHIPVDVKELNCNTLSLAAHKFYGPKGVGALYIKAGTPIESYVLGGDQERGRRASTQNVPGIVGLAKAITLCRQVMPQEMETQTRLRNRIIAEISKNIDGVILNGHPVNRLPNNAHFSFTGLESESLLTSLDMSGIAASMGSACTSGALKPSHVLRAIGLSDALAYGSLRITLGRWTTEEHVNCLIRELPAMVKRLRAV